MRLKKILCLLVLHLVFLAGAQKNIDSLMAAYASLPADKKEDPSDTTAPYLLFVLLQNYVDDEQAGEFSFPLKDMMEKRLPLISKGSVIEQSYKRYQGGAFNDIGMYYREKGDAVNALDYFHKAMRIYEELKDPHTIAEAYNNLAAVYFDIGDKKKALAFFVKSYEILKDISPKAELLQVLANVAFLYYSTDEHALSLRYYDTCLKMAQEVNNKKFISECINGKGLNYFKQKMYPEAIVQFNQSLKIREEIKDKKGIATTLNNIGNYYQETGNYREALNYSLRSLEMSKELGSFERMRQASFGLKRIYEHLGNYKEALKMHELYIQMRDSTNNQMTRKAALEKQLQYEYEKKEIILKQEQERLTRLYEQKQKFYLILSVVLLLLVVIVFYSLYFRYRFKKEEESKNLHIELKERLKKEIKEKEKIANSIIHIQEREREKLAAELHDGVNQLLFAGKIQLQAAKTVEEKMYREGVILIDAAINEIKSIASNQGSFLLNNKSLKDALTDLVQLMKANQQTRITLTAHDFDENVLNIDQKTNILRIIQELLNNAVQHSAANDFFITIKNNDNRVLFAVTDTGRGIDRKTEYSGHGIRNIHNKVTLMKGSYRILTLSNKGTKTFIELPIN